MTKKSTKKSKESTIDKFEWMTKKFIKLLEQGVNPWRKEWRTTKAESIKNFVTGHVYEGKNPLILAMDTLCRGAKESLYCGASQGFAKGWKIKKGSKAAYVTYANVVIKEGEDNDKIIPFVKWLAVFHVEDWDDSDSDNKIADLLHAPQKPLNQDERQELVEKFIKKTGANIKTQGSQPCYIPSKDTILMPAWEDFKNSGSYYGTILHELTHWTGHENRCNRRLGDNFGSPGYAKEELIAEMGAALLSQKFGVSSDIENHASYLSGWLAKAKEDNKFLFRSMTEARKAYEFLIKE